MSEQLAAGWVWDRHAAAVLHFEHMGHKQADRLESRAEAPWVIETINGTLAEEGAAVHHNCYFAHTLSSAIALAAGIEIAAKQVAEEVVNVRPATRAEAEAFGRVYDHYTAQEPVALSEAEAHASVSVIAELDRAADG